MLDIHRQKTGVHVEHDSKYIIKRFLYVTKIEGLKSIQLAKNTLVRLFWTSIVILACGVCLYLVVDNTLTYLEWPTKSIISEINEKNSAFPTIVFCKILIKIA